LTTEKTFSRKIKEAVLAYRITQTYPKKTILQEYLNTVYFGQGSYGIKSAVERFFQHPLNEMTLAEAALLTGVIANPESWNPFTHPEKALQRRKEVLAILRDQKIISEKEENDANNTPLPTVRPSAELKPASIMICSQKHRKLLIKFFRSSLLLQQRWL
jgi:penicillin-binding protein 1A